MELDQPPCTNAAAEPIIELSFETDARAQPASSHRNSNNNFILDQSSNAAAQKATAKPTPPRMLTLSCVSS